MIVTVFLAVLIVALLLGNGFLELTKRRPSAGASAEDSMSRAGNPGHKNTPQPKASDVSRYMALVHANLKSNNKRMDTLNKRMEGMETILLGGRNAKIKPVKLDNLKTAKKFNDLLEFKHIAEIEITALRQRLDKMQNNSNSIPEKQILTEEDEVDFEKKMHSIIYHSGRN